MKIYDILDLSKPHIHTGNHAIWDKTRCIDESGWTVKIPFQWGGLITKYSYKQHTSSLTDTFLDEVDIMRALAERGMTPPIGELVYYRNVISNYPGAWHCDPCGAYGYEMKDANYCAPGKYDPAIWDELNVEISERALGDMNNPKNLVNGYQIDVRRTDWDMPKWTGAQSSVSPEDLKAHELDDEKELVDRVVRDCQFPKGERPEPYQDFWIQGRLYRGAREIESRARKMRFSPKLGESVLDIGCQSGSMLQWSYQTQQDQDTTPEIEHGFPQSRIGKHVGVELESEYVACCRDLARMNQQNICFRQMNVVSEFDSFSSWIKSYFPEGVDHLLLLSMEKHIGETLWKIVDTLNAKNTYIETNAVKPGQMKLWDQVSARGGEHVGDSEDRNTRRLYRIPRR